MGCGNNPKGDVNCDLHTGKTRHRGNGEIIDIKNIKNLVLCDCGSKRFKFLPFRSKTFSASRCDHGIEHFEQFDKTIKEMIRVTRDEVDITLPHRYWRTFLFKKQNPTHVNFLSAKYLRKFVKELGYTPSIHVRYGYPLRIPLLIVPHEVIVEIHLCGWK